MRRMALVVACALLGAGCPIVFGGNGDSGGEGGSGSDAGHHLYDSSSGHDNGSVLRDGGTPDVVAPSSGYAVSNASGQPAAQRSGQTPAGDPSSDTYIDPLNGNCNFVTGGTNPFTGTLHGGSVVSVLVGFAELPAYHFEVPVTAYPEFGYYVTLGQDVTNSSLTMVVVPVLEYSESQPGGYGREKRVQCTVTQVGTGDIQVNLTWDSPTDIDLHLEEPSGFDIYYCDRISPNGGNLDLDANAGCILDSPRVDSENVTYQNAVPANGHYRVRVHYWNNCGVTNDVRYWGTVWVRGVSHTYDGTLSASEVSGSSYDCAPDRLAGRIVYEFDY
ncbi:MAG: hypothetical protein JXR83_22930 [Deltaproteobacteria bacterium]|nr:hypothetical protein [Deltaproteobacteria bacterium]